MIKTELPRIDPDREGRRTKLKSQKRTKRNVKNVSPLSWTTQPIKKIKGWTEAPVDPGGLD